MTSSSFIGTSRAQGLFGSWALDRQFGFGIDPYSGGFPGGPQRLSPFDQLESSYDRSFAAMPDRGGFGRADLGGQGGPLAALLQNPQLVLDLLVMAAMFQSWGNEAKGKGELPATKPWSSGNAVPGGWSKPSGGGPVTAGSSSGGASTSGPSTSGPSTSGPKTVPQPGPQPGPQPAPATNGAPNPAQVVDPGARARYGSELVPKQFGGELSGIQQSSGCGPLAAIGVARSLGKNPDIQDTFKKAESVGWNGDGMNGPANYVRLLDKMGIPAHLEQNASADAIRTSVEEGKPVTISTAKHYFLASEFDPQRGFFVGNSGTAMRGGSEWMTLDQLNNLGGGINGTVFIDGAAPANTGNTALTGATDQTGNAPRLAVYPPRSLEAVALFKQAAHLAGVPESWADSPALHNILEHESNGRVGVPNYTYGARAQDPSQWPAIHDEIRRHEVTARSTATGLGQLLDYNVDRYYPAGRAGIGDPVQEAAGMLAYIKDRYGSPENAWARYNATGEGY